MGTLDQVVAGTSLIYSLHDEARDAVTIYGEIGFPPPDANGRFGEAMLRANHLFSGTDGAFERQPSFALRKEQRNLV